jgi:hypothetical protein
MIIVVISGCGGTCASKEGGASQEGSATTTPVEGGTKKKITMYVGEHTYKTYGNYTYQSIVEEGEGRHSVKDCLADLKLTAEQLASIQLLEIAGEDIQSLEGVEVFTGLEILRIQHTYIASIEAASRFDSLWNMSVAFTPVHAFPENGFPSLTYLCIDWVPLDSYEGILKLGKLEEIQLSYNRRNLSKATSLAESLKARGVKVTIWEWDNANLVSRPDLKNYW